MITVRRIGDTRWEAGGDNGNRVTVRGHRRPDSRLQLVVDGEPGPRYETLDVLLHRVRCDVPGELIHQVDVAETGMAQMFRAAGFQPARTELTVVITLDGHRLTRLSKATGAEVELIGAADADLARLRALDEEIRDDIPGSNGWVWTPADFAWETFGPDFDPATYRVAVDPSSREYLGLLRVWMKPTGPAFGCLGVRRDRRGTRVAAALVVDVLSTLLERGFTSVRANVDDTNHAVLGVIRRFEHEVVGHATEFVHPGT